MNQWPEWLPLKQSLRGRTPYGAPQVEAEARLNTNENPYSLPDSVVAAIEDSIHSHLAGLNRYPDRDALSLRGHLARYIETYVLKDQTHSITAANIWPANGSNEVLQSILLAFGETVAGFTPSYSMHPILAESVGKSFKSVPLQADFAPDFEILKGFLTSRKPDLFFVTTPNNPTGRSLSSAEIASIAESLATHGGLLVVDEAYGEFSDERSAIELLDLHPNLIVVRTLSKALAFAGARLGYAIAREEAIKALQLVRLPYHLSSLTQAAAIAALDNAEILLSGVSHLKVARERVSESLQAMGLTVIPSDANFILFGGERLTAAQNLWQRLLDGGVLIRDVGIQGYLRVTIGTDAENEKFLETLSRLLQGS